MQSLPPWARLFLGFAVSLIVFAALAAYGYAALGFFMAAALALGLAVWFGALLQGARRRHADLTLQTKQATAALASMREAVIALDAEARVLILNAAAARLLDLSLPEAVGRPVMDLLRHAELQDFLTHALANHPATLEEGILQWNGKRRVQANCVPLFDPDGKEYGLLVILRDVTRFHQLETLRREFVANVSHELRTPITSIKGFVETLQGGALREPEVAQNFLAIIARQADRLNAIIEDLLALSRIERDDDGQLEMVQCPLRPVLEHAIQQFGTRAREKNIEVQLDCPTYLHVMGSERLLEQAVGNLLDNAIKYSPAGQPVRVDAALHLDQALIRVIDAGPGIAAQHLPRLFERFYRADTARSRDLGGTGLGLAIVKHIVQTHGGKVSVLSEEGAGSTFMITLPCREP